ncbi:hypothetical protein [Planococcus sp. NCCP-2050]|uniref:hypothetical protein n=1 Tax=Planococcus sp. NCCP-2050 TaxID=2944679 RepID=UPI00203A6814|nr:hypothetical protein [Planococcus sp. NCCP-2050]GKW46593.1 hypothetical protein NCCP2050_22850 [Planococcus sp. NCCP-2050]
MNWVVLNDKKTMAGLILSILLSIAAVFLAVKDNSYWTVLVLAVFVLLFFSISRADRLTKQ